MTTLAELAAPEHTAIVTQECQGAVIGPNAGLAALAEEARRVALPNITRLLPAAREALPGLSGRVTREWMGYRPSTPDSLPVIGPSRRLQARTPPNTMCGRYTLRSSPQAVARGASRLNIGYGGGRTVE